MYKTYSNDDIELEFEYTRNRLKESLSKQNGGLDDFAKLLSVLDDVIQNAIGIEVHNDRYSGTNSADNLLAGAYELISVFRDGKYFVPVRLTVKEFKGALANKLYLAVSSNKIDGNFLTQTTDKSSVKQSSLPSDISLSDLFANVNPFDENCLREFICIKYAKRRSRRKKHLNL